MCRLPVPHSGEFSQPIQAISGLIPMLKRLIEVALPLKEVSEQSAREKSIRHGHISTLHIWWARRPLAACRAAVFASLIPDPDDPECPKDFRTLVMDLLKHERFRPNGQANGKKGRV